MSSPARHAASCDPNVRWHEGTLSREDRWEALESRGGTVWLTGLPSSGKSTLGAALERRLVARGCNAYLLDGDNMRHGVCSDLGFSRADRERNVQRVGDVAQLFADSGTIALVALISPYEATRMEVRERHEREGLPFIEVFLNTPLWLCVERDPKGLYARALGGELERFTGIDDPYEAPRHADLELTPEIEVAPAVDAVLALLRERGLVAAAGATTGAERPGARDRKRPVTARHAVA
jgi:adenylyl-sulfate kinase